MITQKLDLSKPSQSSRPDDTSEEADLKFQPPPGPSVPNIFLNSDVALSDTDEAPRARRQATIQRIERGYTIRWGTQDGEEINIQCEPGTSEDMEFWHLMDCARNEEITIEGPGQMFDAELEPTTAIDENETEDESLIFDPIRIGAPPERPQMVFIPERARRTEMSLWGGMLPPEAHPAHGSIMMVSGEESPRSPNEARDTPVQDPTGDVGLDTPTQETPSCGRELPSSPGWEMVITRALGDPTDRVKAIRVR
jgi:hypothetical protein